MEDQQQPQEQQWIAGQTALVDDIPAHDRDESESEDKNSPIRGATVHNQNSVSQGSEVNKSEEENLNMVMSPVHVAPPELQEAPEENQQNDAIVVQGTGENAFVKFQLIPISQTEGRAAVGEVVERQLKEGQVMKLGRQVMKDGQATIKGNKKATEIDVWFTSKVVSRLHAEIWTKDGQLCVKDVGSSSGTFLNGMRLSPSTKESGPYPMKQGDILQFGVDFKGKSDSDIYRAILMKIGFHDQSWLAAQRANANPQRFSAALKQLLAATNPYAKNSDQNAEGETDCCICIGAIAPFQALFIAPCSHCYHYKCVGYLIAQSPMFQCPMCRQVANLTASVSSDDLSSELKQNTPLPVLAIDLDEKEKKEERPADQPTIQRSNSNRTKRPGLVERLGLGILKSSHASHSAHPPADIPESQKSPEEQSPSASNALQKKRTFSMKLKSFVHGKSVQESDSEGQGQAVPRTQHPVPGEAQNQQQEQNQQEQAQARENQSAQQTN